MSKFANLDVEFMVEAMPLLLKATKMTLFLAIVSLVLAFILGLILASIRYFHVKVLSQIARFYVSFFRGTPLIVQLFLIYFGVFTMSPVFCSSSTRRKLRKNMVKQQIQGYLFNKSTEYGERRCA